MADVSYVPGPLTAVTGEHCWALVEAAPDSPVVARIWQQFGQAPAADALLAGLLADGIGAAGGFALLAAEPGGPYRLFCRAAVGATLEGQSAFERVDGAGLLTWREQVITDAERIFLGEPPADSALRLPAASGVLLAGCVIIDLTNVGARETGAYAARRKTVVLSPDTITVPPSDDVGHLPDPAAAGQARPEGREPATAPAPSVQVTAPAAQAGQPGQEVQGPAAFIAPAPPAELSRGGGDGEYDFLWGATQMRSVEDAAIRGQEDGDPAGFFPSDGVPVAGGPWPGRLTSGPQPAAYPWQGPGGTVKRGDVPEPAAGRTPPDRIGPVVPALVCPSGHLNPPSEAACRRCGTVLPHDPVPVPRPVLGVLRLSLGDVITLDRGVVMGRNPRKDFGGPDGEERPHVVKMPSAEGDISRTHLRVTLDGWHVLVTDLNSTNGTLVTLPGRDPQQLRPGEPVPIQPGTVVTLAEGIDFRYEAAE